MVTVLPTLPLVGVKLVMVGAVVTVKLPTEVAVPPAVVTARVPGVAPLGTMAFIWVADIPTKSVLLVPLNLTAVAPVKLVPVMETNVPTGPLVGVKLLTAGSNVKLLLLVAVPPAVVTAMFPVVAPLGTVAVIWVMELTV